VRDLVDEKIVNLRKIDTQDQLADILVTFKTVANFHSIQGKLKPQE
jgi:hypothetical protein